MRVQIKKKYAYLSSAICISLLYSLLLLAGTSVFSEFVEAANVTNQTVLARVNITNTEPFLYDVFIASPQLPIDLTAGGETIVQCNGTFQDLDGFADITNVTATLFKDEVGSVAPDDNNTHYTNFSCGGCTEVLGTGGQNGTCSCQFPVQYYARNGSWRCNMTISDTFLLNSSNASDPFTVNEVLGIDVETLVLDYGNLSVTQVSLPTRENVTNIGNVPINVTLKGYGGTNETIGTNLSMICGEGGNISFNAQRFALNNVTDYADMFNLSNQTSQIPGFTLPKRTDNAKPGNSSNSTFFRIEIPLGVGGVCNGTIIFGAVQAGVGPGT